MIKQKTNELAHQIKQSEQYLDFEKYKSLVEEDEFLSKLVCEHKRVSFKANAYNISGDEIPQTIIQKLESLDNILMDDEITQGYFIAEYNFNKLFGDIIATLSKSVGVGIGFLQE